MEIFIKKNQLLKSRHNTVINIVCQNLNVKTLKLWLIKIMIIIVYRKFYKWVNFIFHTFYIPKFITFK